MIPTLEQIREARERIRPHVRQTPILQCPSIDEQSAAAVYFKCENLQHGGAFKARGACNAILSLTGDEASCGVVTHSSGNHAAAVARAAKIRGIRATIVMPRNTSPLKIRAVESFGILPVFCEPTAEARQSAADAVIAEAGAALIHPYDDPRTIAGQGTVALELVEQLETPDVVIVPVGGGGLLSGTLIVLKSLWPTVRVIAAEPARADDAWRSLQSGQIEPPLRYDTVADGLRTPLGQHTFPIIRDLVDEIVLVEESDILRWTRAMLELAKLVVEPSGAVPLAALMTNRERFAGQRVAMIVSGGNLDLDHLPWLESEDGK